MHTLGVDLSAQPQNTAACLIRWGAGSAVVEELELPIDDDRLFELAGRADKVGLDVPFGWPAAFVAAIHAHAQLERWPATETVALRFRRTDLFIRERTGRWPLSVSTDRIGITTFRAARLLSHERVDRTGAGKFVEVYPRAARNSFEIGVSLEDLVVRASWLELDDETATKCAGSEHCMDAVIAALVARASALGLCEPIPEEDLDAARREGWIALPRPGALERLASGPFETHNLKP